MAVDIESIWQALYDRIESKCPEFVTVTRRRRMDFGMEELPAALILDDNGDETPSREDDDLPPAWVLTGEVILWARDPGPTDEKPTAKLNDLVRSVRSALERQASESTTGTRGAVQFYTNLGNRVRKFAITRVEKGAGEVTGKAIAKITLEMEAL